MSEFSGDVLLVSTPDGGDLRLADGQVISDQAFTTAVYLSLFGGNQDDAGTVTTNKTWWGNLLPGAVHERMVSRFQSYITAQPMTTKTIPEALSAAEQDVQWLIDAGIADRVIVGGRAGPGNTFILHVTLETEGAGVYEHAFSVFWQVGVYGRI